MQGRRRRLIPVIDVFYATRVDLFLDTGVAMFSGYRVTRKGSLTGAATFHTAASFHNVVATGSTFEAVTA
jgi:hypothetical protein